MSEISREVGMIDDLAEWDGLSKEEKIIRAKADAALMSSLKKQQFPPDVGQRLKQIRAGLRNNDFTVADIGTSENELEEIRYWAQINADRV